MHTASRIDFYNELERLHPEFADLIVDPDFIAWIRAHPDLCDRVKVTYDIQIANELFSTFKAARH